MEEQEKSSDGEKHRYGRDEQTQMLQRIPVPSSSAATDHNSTTADITTASNSYSNSNSNSNSNQYQNQHEESSTTMDTTSVSRTATATTSLPEEEFSSKRSLNHHSVLDLGKGYTASSQSSTKEQRRLGAISDDDRAMSGASNGNSEVSNKRLKSGNSYADSFPKTPTTKPMPNAPTNGVSEDGIAYGDRPLPTPPPSTASIATNENTSCSSVGHHSENAALPFGSGTAAATTTPKARSSPYRKAPFSSDVSGGGGWTDDDAYERMPKTPVAPQLTSSSSSSSSRATMRQNAMSPLPGASGMYLSDVPPAPPTTPAPKLSGTGYRDLGLATPLPYTAGFVQNTNHLEQQQRQYQQRQKHLQQQELQEGAATPAPHRAQHKTDTAAAKPPAATKAPTSSLSDDFSEWAVGDRYQLNRMLGRGSYGEVARAIDKYQGRPDAFVAIKRIVGPFDQEVDAVRLFREIHILRRLRTLGKNDCIVPLLDVVQPPTDDLNDFNDLYLVFDYVDTDLYKLIMSPQYLTTEHIQTFLYQMLIGLKYIHSGNVIHRDLKPANILLNEDCSLKVRTRKHA